jgi:hypothetical protein
MAIWYCFWPFGIFMIIWYCFWPFVIFMVIWYIFSHFGMLYQEKSGNPAGQLSKKYVRTKIAAPENYFCRWMRKELGLTAHCKIWI